MNIRHTAYRSGSAGILFLALVFFLFPPPPSRSTSVRSLPVQDFRLTVLIFGSWRGRFAADEEGRGGLAALHAYVERRRMYVRAANGEVLLLQAGDWSGARDSGEFRRGLFPEKISLASYLKLDALSASMSELDLIARMKPSEELSRLPLVSMNYDPPRKKNRGILPRPYRLLSRRGRSIYVSALTRGGRMNPAALTGLVRALESEDKTALKILLLDFSPDDPRLPPERRKKREVDSLDFIASGAREPARKLPSLGKLFPAKSGWRSPENPYERIAYNSPLNRVLIARTGARENRFFRLLNGAYYCSLGGRVVCEAEFHFRGGRIIQVKQRFVRVNARGEASAWIAPDRTLLNLLRRARK